MSSSRHLNKLLSLALAMLMIALPVASAVNVTNTTAPVQAAPGTLDVVASLPQYIHEPTLTIEGTTKPGANVHVFVNGVRMRVVTATTAGVFKATNVAMPESENTIKLQAYLGAVAGPAKEFKVISDSTPPIVKLTQEIPASTTSNSLTVAGDVNEKVTIYYRLINRQDTTPPAIVAGLRVNKIEPNAIELVWDPNPDADLKEYSIERSGKRIATASLPSYKDINLAPATEYSYSVSAIDTSCNSGISADLLAKTSSGGQAAATSIFTAINLSCEPAYQTMKAGSPFSITFALVQGYNDIEIVFVDAAGNKAVIEKTVKLDTSGPKFLETNLEQLSPSYAPDVTVKGKLDEQATIFLYINNDNKPADFVVTETDGSFSIKTKLRTDVRIKKGTTTATIAVGEGWANKIRLEAVDLAGNKAAHGPVDIDFLMCGSGTWWQANVGEAMPSVLLPRLMIQGIQQIGIPFNITYIGSQKVKLGKVDVRPIPLAKGSEKDYDHDWVQVSEYTRAKGQNNLVGYVQIQFENVNPLPDEPTAGPNKKELALSGHRRGECLVPGTGCVKLFLQMEITFQEIIEMKAADPRMPMVTPKIEPRVQKICMPLEVGIDQTIPTDIIPKGLLRAAVKVIDNAISLIDKIMKPLTTIGEYVLYGCLASNVWLYVSYYQEKMACEASAVVNEFSKAVAEAGICDAVYGNTQSQDAQKQASCNKCQKSMETRKKFELNIMHGLCDRSMCPSAPTFSTYIKDNVGNAEPLDIEPSSITSNPELANWQVGGTEGKIYSGNDCAFTYKTSDPKKTGMDLITPAYKSGSGIATVTPTSGTAGGALTTGEQAATQQMVAGEISGSTPVSTAQITQTPTTYTYGKLGVRDLFDFSKGKKELPGPTLDDCKKMLHPAHPNCCGIEYQKEWSSACGVGTVLGESLDLFDELKESTCLSAQQANAQDIGDLNCNRLWNSVAGFCESNTGAPSAQVVNLESNWQGPTPVRPGADDNAAYIFVIPAGDFSAGRTSFINPSASFLGGGGEAPQYAVWAGYAVKTPKFEKMTESELAGVQKKNQFRLSASMTAALEKDVSGCFGMKAAVRAEQSATKPEMQTDKEQAACLQKALCTDYPSSYKISPCDPVAIKKAYDQVNDIVGVPDQQYIVRPSSGLFRSIQCICLPAVVGYLNMWRSILGAFHGCFTKILLTGEGSTGFCAAKFSGTICDLFFEAISCITQKFNSPGVGGRTSTGGFGDVLGALTGAGTSVSKSVNQRYGESSVYKSLFSERKLLHAICTWAFTGTWSLNVQGLFQQQVAEMPIDTEGALMTCERTFISYDPTTSPSGLTTWAYRIAGGMIAGADLSYRLKLKCSSGYNCDPSDYTDGKCDCTAQERTIYANSPELGNGLAKKFAVIDFDAPFVVSAQSQPDSDVRYDTATLEWEWKDATTRQVRTGNVQCSIRETQGGNAPAFCGFDLFSARFRCLFGEQESGIRMVSAAQNYPAGQEVFIIGDKLSLGIDIKQKFPEERRFQNQGKKFLSYQIKDSAGQIIDAAMPDGTRKQLKTDINDVTTEQYTLSTNGVYKMVVPKEVDVTPLGLFVLNADTITRHSAAGPTASQAPQDIWGVTTIVKFVRNINVDTIDGKPATEPIWFSIYFPNYINDAPGEETFTIHRITPPGNQETIPSKSMTEGWKQFRSGPLYGPIKQAVDKPVNTVSFRLPAANISKEMNVNIEFGHISGFTKVRQLEILVGYIPGKEAAKTASGCDASKQVTWNALLSIYDADRQGNPTEQISTDPETGEEQQKTIAFQVQCATKAQYAALKPLTTAPVLSDSAQLQMLLKQAIDNTQQWVQSLQAVQPKTKWLAPGFDLNLGKGGVQETKILISNIMAGVSLQRNQIGQLMTKVNKSDLMPAQKLNEVDSALQTVLTDLNAATIDPVKIDVSITLAATRILELGLNNWVALETKFAGAQGTTGAPGTPAQAAAPAAQTSTTVLKAPTGQTAEELDRLSEGTVILITTFGGLQQQKYVKQPEYGWTFVAWRSDPVTYPAAQFTAIDNPRTFTSQELIEVNGKDKWEIQP